MEGGGKTLSWNTVLARRGAQCGVGVLGVIPVPGVLTSVHDWLDGLSWPEGRRAYHRAP